MIKILKYWRKKTEDTRSSHDHRLEELILQKWLYYQIWSTHSIQSPPVFQLYSGKWKNNSEIHTKTQKTPNTHVIVSKSNSVKQKSYIVLLHLFVAMIKPGPKLGEENICWFTGYSLSLKEVKARTQGRKLKVGTEWSRGNEGGLIYIACPTCFLYQPRPPAQKSRTSHINHQLDNAPQNIYRPVRWRQFLSWGSLSPGDSSLWQADKR